MSANAAVTLIGTVAVLVCMSQAWISLPFVGNVASTVRTLMEQAMQSGDFSGISIGGIGPSDLLTFADTFVKASWGPFDLLNLSSVLSWIASWGSSLLVSSGADTTTYSAAIQALGSLGTLAIVMNVVFALWALCFVAIICGLALRLIKGRTGVLTAALAATAVMSLVCIVGTLVINGQLEGALDAFVTGLIADGGHFFDGAQSLYDALKPLIAPGLGAICTLVASIATVVASHAIRERP